MLIVKAVKSIFGALHSHPLPGPSHSPKCWFFFSFSIIACALAISPLKSPRKAHRFCVLPNLLWHIDHVRKYIPPYQSSPQLRRRPPSPSLVFLSFRSRPHMYPQLINALPSGGSGVFESDRGEEELPGGVALKSCRPARGGRVRPGTRLTPRTVIWTVIWTLRTRRRGSRMTKKINSARVKVEADTCRRCWGRGCRFAWGGVIGSRKSSRTRHGIRNRQWTLCYGWRPWSVYEPPKDTPFGGLRWFAFDIGRRRR